MKKKKNPTYFCEEAKTFMGVLDFLNDNDIMACPQRLRVIRHLLTSADENGIVRTTYEKTVKDLGNIELNTVGQTFRMLMNAGLVSMTRTNRGVKELTEYEIKKDVLQKLVNAAE